MQRQRNNSFIGIVFIILGGLFLLKNIGFDITPRIRDIAGMLWPFLLILIGVIMHITYFSNRGRDEGILVPAGILTTYGILFFLQMLGIAFLHINLMRYLWPVFPLGVAIGLFELYIFGNRQKGLLIPVGILGGFSIIALTLNIAGGIFMGLQHLLIPILLILFGAGIVLKNRS